MFCRSKIKLERDLVKRAREYSEQAGYSSVEEFITHLIEGEISKSASSEESEEELKKRLEGLGYIS